MPPHTDLLDSLAFVAGPLVLGFALLLPPGRRRRGAATVACLAVAWLLADVPAQLPPSPAEGEPMFALAVLLALLPLLLVRIHGALALVAACAVPPVLGALVLWVVHAASSGAAAGGADSVLAGRLAASALGNLSGPGGPMASIGLLLALLVGLARGRSARGSGRGLPWLLVAPLFVLPAASVGEQGAAVVAPLVFVAALLGARWSRTRQLEAALLTRLETRWAAGLLMACTLAAAWTGVSLGSDTGWISMGGSLRLLPMTATYLGLPLLAGALLWDGAWNRPAAIAMEVVLLCVLIVGLALQRESGLILLIVAAWLLARAVSLGQAVRFGRAVLVLGAGGLLAMAGAALVPDFVSILAAPLERVATSRGAFWDLSQLQLVTAAAIVREAGPLGLGLHEPGGPFDLRAWNNDFLPAIAHRQLGLAGSWGLAIAALLPPLALLRVAVDADFRSDRDHSRVFLVTAVAWAAMHGGGALLLAAGALGVAPLTGVTFGLVVPATNHFLFAMPVLAWGTLRSIATPRRAEPWPRRGLRSFAAASGLALALLAGLVLHAVTERALCDDMVAVLPLQGAPELSFARVSDGVLIDARGGATIEPLGTVLSVDGTLFELEPGPRVRLRGFRWEAPVLRREVRLGAAGHDAPALPLFARAVGRQVAWFNDVRLSGSGARWREATFYSEGGRPAIRASTPDGRVVVERPGPGGFAAACRSTRPEESCAMAAGDRVRMGADAFLVRSVEGGVLAVDWVSGAPEPWPVPEGRRLRLGGRHLAPLVERDQLWNLAGQDAVALLGELGVLGLDARGRPSVLAPPAVDPAAHPDLQALQRVGVAIFGTLMRRSTRCADGYRWRLNRDPLFGSAPCLADAPAERFRVDPVSGQIEGLRRIPTRLVDPYLRAGSLVPRGPLLDRAGRPLAVRQGAGFEPAHPSLEPLVGRYLGAGSGRSSGLQFTFHRVLVGRTDRSSPRLEFSRRLAMSPRLNSGRLVTTLSLPLQDAVAAAVAEQATTLADRSAGRPGRSWVEGRASGCHEYAVHAVVSSASGDILAVASALARADAHGAELRWSRTASDQSCLPDFGGSVGALHHAQPVGSVMKPFVLALAMDARPELFAPADDRLLVRNPGDPEHGRGLWLEDEDGILRTFLGLDVPNVRNYRVGGVPLPSGRFEVVDMLRRSANVPSFYVAELAGAEAIVAAAGQLDLLGSADLLGEMDEPELELALFRRSGGPLDGRAGNWSAPLETGSPPGVAGRIALGGGVRLSALGLNNLGRVLAGDGVYGSPRLVREVGFGNGRTARPRLASRRVFGVAAVAWTLRGMEAARDPGGTAHQALRGMEPALLQRLAVKTGTPELTTASGRDLASHKTALGVLRLPEGEPLVISVFAQHAQGLDDLAALRVLREIVEAASDLAPADSGLGSVGTGAGMVGRLSPLEPRR